MTEQNNSPQIASLEDYLNAVRRHWPTLVGVAAVFMFLCLLAIGQRVDSYTGDARIVVDQLPTDGNSKLYLEREVEVVQSDDAFTNVAAVNGISVGDLHSAANVSFEPNSDVIRIEVKTDDPKLSAGLANGLAETYTAERLDLQATYYINQQTVIAAEITSLGDQMDELDAALITIDSQRRDLVSQTGSDARTEALAANSQDRNSINTELSDVRRRVVALQAELSNLERTKTSEPAAARLIRRASTDTAPNGLSTSVYVIAALIGSIVVGIAGAFMHSRLDKSVVEASDVEPIVGAPVLGEIARFGKRVRKLGVPVMISGSSHWRDIRAKESFNRLRSAVMFALKPLGRNAVVVSSLVPGEGKSTVSANLAVAAANAGNRVALVSGDLRRPALERYLGIDNSEGLTTWDRTDVSTVRVAEVSGVPNLRLIPAGPPIQDASVVLSSQGFLDFIEYIKAEVDLVVFDSPPIDAAADATTAAAVVGPMVVVIDSTQADIPDLRQIRQTLNRVGVPLLGTVLNRQPDRGTGILSRRRAVYYTTD